MVLALKPVELAHTESGAVIVQSGVSSTVTFLEQEAEQAPSVTVTFSVTGLVSPASQVMEDVLVAEVIVPFVMVQL